MSWEPSTLKRHEEGDSIQFQAKLTGAGANDMCNMQVRSAQRTLKAVAMAMWAASLACGLRLRAACGGTHW